MPARARKPAAKKSPSDKNSATEAEELLNPTVAEDSEHESDASEDDADEMDPQPEEDEASEEEVSEDDEENEEEQERSEARLDTTGAEDARMAAVRSGMHPALRDVMFDPDAPTYEPMPDSSSAMHILPRATWRSSRRLSHPEFTEVVGLRATQIELTNTNFLTDDGKVRTPIEVAEEEIRRRRCPMSIRRVMGQQNGRVVVEVIPVNDLLMPSGVA